MDYRSGFGNFYLSMSEVNKERRWADLPAKEQNRLIKNMCNCEFSIQGKTTFKEEFVTAGGIRLNEIDAEYYDEQKNSLTCFLPEKYWMWME